MRRAITLYTFLVRLYNYDDERLAEVEELLRDTDYDLTKLHHDFYKHYEKGFCIKTKEKVTINVHSFLHLLQVRKKSGPLWKNSAEDFESLFAITRRGYWAGTRNVPKQILENYFLRDM